MKIEVKIENIEVTYEENNYKTTKEQDIFFLDNCIQKALKLYEETRKVNGEQDD